MQYFCTLELEVTPVEHRKASLASAVVEVLQASRLVRHRRCASSHVYRN